MSWTEERVELLSKLWSDGLSASQIATQLGGVTRNAVIGKVHRLKLEGRARVAILEQVADSSNAKIDQNEVIVESFVEIEMPVRLAASQGSIRNLPRPHGANALKMDPEVDAGAVPRPSGEVVPISRNLTLVQLSERTCKWPLGDPLSPDFRFCGNHSNDASPYCAYHARIAFQPASERRRVR